MGFDLITEQYLQERGFVKGKLPGLWIRYHRKFNYYQGGRGDLVIGKNDDYFFSYNIISKKCRFNHMDLITGLIETESQLEDLYAYKMNEMLTKIEKV